MATGKYKNTEIGVIPKDWVIKRFRDVAKFYSGGTPLTSNDKYFNGKIPFIKSGEIYSDKTDQLISVEGLDNSSAKMVKKGDLLYALYGANSGEVAISKISGAINQAILCINPDKIIDTAFICNYLTYCKERIIKNYLQGGQGNLSAEIIKSLFVLIPPLSEQKKIANILNIWDVAIYNCKSLIALFKKRKEWLAHQLLFNKSKYFDQGAIKMLPLHKIIDRIKNPIVPEPQKLYKQIGIRSHAKGIFYKEEVTGKSLGKKAVFHIEPDCFIVNIVFAWEHAIAKTTANEVGMIASHRFPMFKPKEGLLELNYLLHFFKSKKGKDLLALASPGGAGRNKTLGQAEFLKLQMPVPAFKDQQKIAELLNKADEEIQLYKNKLGQLQMQKKGLMQQLLTGKTRVNY